MAQTTLLAAGTAAANSADDVVAAGAVVAYILFASDGVISSDVQVFVDRKVGANYQAATAGGEPIILNMHHTVARIDMPGTYRVRKRATQEAIGIAKDA